MPIWTAEDGSEINYELYGKVEDGKPALLLLPGLLGAINSSWRSFLRPLSADFMVVYPDLRGHGRSTNNASNLDLETMMFDLSGLLDSLSVDVVNIVGYSLGGYLGLMLALKEPRRVASVIMHATKFYWTEDAVAKMHKQLDPDYMAQKVPTYADQLVQDHGARHWRVLVRQAVDLISYMVRDGVSERMASHTQCPVLVSVGDRDELVHINEALRLARLFPKGELIVLPGVRHPIQTLRQIPFLPMVQHFSQGGV